MDSLTWSRFVRPGLTLIELIILALIMSISAAVVVPNWIRQQESVRLSSAALAVASDFRALRNHASRTSQPLSVRFQNSVLTVSPPVPELIGDSKGRIDYSLRYPGVSFKGASLPGANEFDIDIRGDLFFLSTNPIYPSARAMGRYVTLVLGSLQKKVQLQANASSGPTDDSAVSPDSGSGSGSSGSSTPTQSAITSTSP